MPKLRQHFYDEGEYEKILLIDMHCKLFSPSFESVRYACKVAKKKGIDGFVVANHSDIEESKKVKEIYEDLKKDSLVDDLLIMCGVEIRPENKHLLILDVDENIEGETIDEAIDQTVERDAIVIVPHPHVPETSLGEDDIRKKVEKLHGLESYNSRVFMPPWNRMAQILAEELKLTKLGVSYAHTLDRIADGGTIFKDIDTEEEIYKSVRKNENILGYFDLYPLTLAKLESMYDITSHFITGSGSKKFAMLAPLRAGRDIIMLGKKIQKHL